MGLILPDAASLDEASVSSSAASRAFSIESFVRTVDIDVCTRGQQYELEGRPVQCPYATHGSYNLTACRKECHRAPNDMVWLEDCNTFKFVTYFINCAFDM